MRFNVFDSRFDTYAVYLNGEIQKYATEADDSEGWVRTERTLKGWFPTSYRKREMKYGRVHITKMEGYDLSYFRAKEFVITEEQQVAETD
jgi:hypothetical protein